MAAAATTDAMEPELGPGPGMAPARNPWVTADWVIVAALVAWLGYVSISGGAFAAMFASGGEFVAELGRLLGLVAAALLFVQVLFMARLPLFERGFGHERIVRNHRRTGIWLFWLAIGHVLAIIIGYAATSGEGWRGLWPTIWELVAHMGGGLLATVAFALLLLVVVTSFKRRRARLRYESWHLIHLYGYLAAILALPHQIWAGVSFAGRPVVSGIWWGLWALAVAVVLLFRLLLPLARSFAHGLRVLSVRPDGTRGLLIEIVGRRLDKLGARAGQFFVWRFLDGSGWTEGHPFSLAAVHPTSGVAADGQTMTICVGIVGDGTQDLTTLRPGTRVIAEGPYGQLTGALRTRPNLLGIAAGAGIAPVFAILQDEPWQPGQAVLITRDDDAGRALMTEQIQALVAQRGLRWLPMNGDAAPVPTWLPGSERRSGPQILAGAVGDTPLTDWDVFLCGPPKWMDGVKADLAAAGVPGSQVHSESFSM